MYTDIQTHANTQIHASIRTSPIMVHPHQHTPTSHNPDVCAYRSIPIHACTPSLPLSHTHPQAYCLPCRPPLYLIRHQCRLWACLQQRCNHLKPCSVLYCPMQRQPAILRKSRQQAMSAHYTCSQQATQPKGRVLLPAAPLWISDASPLVSHMCSMCSCAYG